MSTRGYRRQRIEFALPGDRHGPSAPDRQARVDGGLQTNDNEMIAQGHCGREWWTANPHCAENIEKCSKEFK